jgi:protein phosphatase-4 regulatory subunit 3
VYELRDASWFDRGTGQCKGVYDDTQDLALIIVEAEDMSEGKDGEGGGATEGEGGFLKEELLLSTKVEKEDIYTLIVWTEPQSNLDIALSFQDPDGCEDIWSFIGDVQRHLNNLPSKLK